MNHLLGNSFIIPESEVKLDNEIIKKGGCAPVYKTIINNKEFA
jgi:hypothetical protein